MPQLWSILLAVFLGRLKSEKFHFGENCCDFPSLLPPPPSSSFGGEMRDFILVLVLFLKLWMEKKKILCWHTADFPIKLTVFGHELSTTDIVPRGGLCFPSISPAKGKRKKEF